MAATHPTKSKVVVSGILFWYPLAGVTYQFLHYLIGLRRLGYDPYYIEDSSRWVYDPVANEFSPHAARNIAMIAPILEAFGFEERWAFRGNYSLGGCYGMSPGQITDVYHTADAFLNVTASQELRAEHFAIPRRIYVETDPFAVQVSIAQGEQYTITELEGHHLLCSFGENLGTPDCVVPTGGFRWLPTRQPVIMDLWTAPYTAAGEAYTTITTWHNENKDIEFQGERYYWTKDREFLKILDLPQRADGIFELATQVDDATTRLLLRHQWRLQHSGRISNDLLRYRDYIQRSRGEFTVAKDQVARPRTGWFSDRSACYLAAGRPVITQETGFSKFLPTGKGLFGFTTLEDIITAVDTIASDYQGASRAAREIASEYFAAEKVIAKLMQYAGF